MPENSQTKFLEQLLKDRKTKVDQAVLDTIASCVILDLPIHDIHYVERRLNEILEEMLKRVEYKHEEVTKLRTELLKKNVHDTMKKLPGQRRFSAKSKDSTEERDKRCEPLVFEIMQRLFSEDILLSEPEYVAKIFEEQQEQAVYIQFKGFVDSFFSLLTLSMEAHLDVGNKILWNGKDREHITFRELDNVLKSPKK